MLCDTITEIEQANSNVAPLDFTISNIAWLNSQEAWDKSGRAHLMISLKSKAAANTAIDLNLAVCGVMCSVSIYIPHPLQCYQCQDWGHEVMECTGDE